MLLHPPNHATCKCMTALNLLHNIDYWGKSLYKIADEIKEDEPKPTKDQKSKPKKDKKGGTGGDEFDTDEFMDVLLGNDAEKEQLSAGLTGFGFDGKHMATRLKKFGDLNKNKKAREKAKEILMTSRKKNKFISEQDKSSKLSTESSIIKRKYLKKNKDVESDKINRYIKRRKALSFTSNGGRETFSETTNSSMNDTSNSTPPNTNASHIHHSPPPKPTPPPQHDLTMNDLTNDVSDSSLTTVNSGINPCFVFIF